MAVSADIATAIAARVAAITGMRGCASTDVASIPATPYGSVGLPSYTMEQGSWERVDISWPVRIFTARVADEPRVTVASYDLADGFIAAMRTGVTGGTALAAAGVVASLIKSINLDAFYTVAGENYQAIDAVVVTAVARGVAYTV